MQVIKRFWTDRSGATLIEYGIILVVLSLTIIGGIGHALNSVEWLFSSNESRLNQAIQP